MGKKEHLKKLTNAKGFISAAAMDQRGSLKKAIAKEMKVEPDLVTPAMMAEFKTAVSKVLTPHASAILLDPEFGLEAALARAKGCGLLLAYESTGYDQTSPGRLPLLIPHWTVSQSIAAGANAIKILMYYSPFDKPEINAIKQAWIERIGIECAYHDIPFFLEFVGYDVNGKGESDLNYAKIKPEVVGGSMAEFSKPHYRIDVLKVEVPINMKFVGQAYSKDEAKKHFQKVAAMTHLPFIYLSAGVSDAEFRASLELAIEAGVKFNGVLCGRATWKDGIPIYGKSGIKAFEDWLSDRGVQNIQALNQILDSGAKPIPGL